MPILRMIDLNQIQLAASGQPSTNNTLSPETRQLCLTLLTNAKKYYAWSPSLDDSDFSTALAMVEQAIAEITTGV